MRKGKSIGVVIPALNEAQSVGCVIAEIPSFADCIIVADNGSTDGTAQAAREAGAVVVHEAERGYGAACLRAIAALPPVDIVVFLDADYSDYPGEMALLVDPIIDGEARIVIGSRVAGRAQEGALTPQQRLGNWLACRLMRLRWGVHYSDLGPFRAIERRALERLAMSERTFGWTVEMQIKAARLGYSYAEVPVCYRRRIGTSKVSGTIKGTVLAGFGILSVIARHALRAAPPVSAADRSGGREERSRY
ncbi:MAG: glycosyltransferase family 2 protein [Hyphomicrobiaceae bacterium]|nr:MAG: glycosyltransferase family 2 protein [Hyphomicrobiaceae bacterium]